MQLEQSGIPTVVVATTMFEPLTRQCLSSFGLAAGRYLVVEHPIGAVDEATILTRADAAVEDAIRLLTV